MSTSQEVTSASDVRTNVDELDEIFRAAAKRGNLEEVFSKERKRLVSDLFYKKVWKSSQFRAG